MNDSLLLVVEKTFFNNVLFIKSIIDIKVRLEF